MSNDDFDFELDDEFLTVMEEVFITSYMVNGPEEAPGIPEDIPPALVLGPIRIARLNLELKGEIDAVIEGFHEENEEVEEVIPGVSLTEDHLEARLAQELSDKIFGYFSLASALIEQFSVELLSSELINEEYRGSNKTEVLLRRSMSQEMREALLLRTGIIGNGLHSEISEVRDLRNDLIHDPGYRLFLKRGPQVVKDMDSAFEAVQDLCDLAIGDSAFTFSFD